MKRLYIFIVFFLFMGVAIFVSAQDLIVLRDGNIIEARVLERTPSEIKYKRFDHLYGPTIVLPRNDVLSIRYENGRVEYFNTAQSSQSRQSQTSSDDNTRFNSLGITAGYLGISSFGFSLNGTVSPGPYTFFDFNLGLGFSNFSFNGNINFAGFVPFNNGGWFGGLGIGGGLYEYGTDIGGYFAFNAITGFVFVNWLNLSIALQMKLLPEFNINIKPMIGYVYQFNNSDNAMTYRERDRKRHEREVRNAMKSADVKENWVSVGYNYLLNADIRYERMLSPRLSLGLNISVPFFNYEPSYSIEVPFRFYPWGKTFFIETSIGYSIASYYDYDYDGWYDNVSLGTTLGLGLGWKVDFGEPGGFFFQIVIKPSLHISGISISGSGTAGSAFYYSIGSLGIGYAF